MLKGHHFCCHTASKWQHWKNALLFSGTIFFSVSWGDMFAGRKDRIKPGWEIIVARARFSRSWGKPWWWSAQFHSIHLLLLSINYLEDPLNERGLCGFFTGNKGHIGSHYSSGRTSLQMCGREKKAQGPGLGPTCKLGLSRWFPGSTLPLRFCPLPPFLNFHISQHVTYPDLFISHKTELLSLSFLGYVRRWKIYFKSCYFPCSATFKEEWT